VSEPRSDHEWIDFYADQRRVYDAFVERLEDLLEILLDEDDIDYAWVISFTCSRDVFAEDLSRARRAGLAVENPLESPRRVAGVSIGIETNRPAAEIGDLVRREFVIDSAGTFSVEEAAASTEPFGSSLGSDRLTYDYPHYLVSLDERRLELAEWSRFAGLKARIEVKTLLQDAWQGIDLDLPFRNASSYPAEVRDLLERSTLGLAAVAAGDLQLPVNGVSLLAYIRASELVQSLTELGRDVDLQYDAEYEPDWYAVEHRILWLLRSADVHTVAELEDFLKQATPRARDTLAELARVATDRGFTPWSLPEAVVEWLWVVLRRADAETISHLRYADELEYALNTLIGNPIAADEPEAT
jgi:hypothetical protein